MRDQKVQIDKLKQEVQAKEKEIDGVMIQFQYVMDMKEALQRNEDPTLVPPPKDDISISNCQSDDIADDLQFQDPQECIKKLQKLLKETRENLKLERNMVQTQQIHIDNLTRKMELQQKEIDALKKDNK